MDVVRIGFIGLGGIATRSHMPALASLPGVVVQAGAEVNPEQAKRTQRRFRVPKMYSSYQEMIREEPLDAVYVCLPNFLHYEAALAALAQGLHVYCEKPMGLSSKEALALVVEAGSRDLVLMPGFNLRFHPYFNRARRLIEDKRIGRILQIQGIAAKPGPYIGWDPKSDWYFDQRNVGVLYDQGSHVLDLLFYMVDLDVETACAVSHTSLPGLPVPDNVVVAFRSRSDFIGSLNLAWGAAGNLTMLQIHGTAGTIIVSDGYFEHRTLQGGGIERLSTLLDNTWEILSRTGNSLIRRQSSETTYLEASRNFIEAIAGRAPLRASARDSVRVHRVLEEIRDSLQQGESGAQQRVALE
jgi:predicted dehydrogenase